MSKWTSTGPVDEPNERCCEQCGEWDSSVYPRRIPESDWADGLMLCKECYQEIRSELQTVGNYEKWERDYPEEFEQFKRNLQKMIKNQIDHEDNDSIQA